MSFRCRDNQDNLVFVFRKHNEIGNTHEPAVLDRVHFFLRVPMAVPKTDFGICIQLSRRQ